MIVQFRIGCVVEMHESQNLNRQATILGTL